MVALDADATDSASLEAYLASREDGIADIMRRGLPHEIVELVAAIVARVDLTQESRLQQIVSSIFVGLNSRFFIFSGSLRSGQTQQIAAE